MKFTSHISVLTALAFALSTSVTWASPVKTSENSTTVDIAIAADRFFGDASRDVAERIANIIDENGRPTAVIEGEELAGAFFGGLRFGRGEFKSTEEGIGSAEQIYWNGPSAGYDFGANASKVMYLIYGVQSAKDMHRRFAAVEGAGYLGPGVGLGYKLGDDVRVIPVRAGVGMRAGANVGYVKFTSQPDWLPF